MAAWYTITITIRLALSIAFNIFHSDV